MAPTHSSKSSSARLLKKSLLLATASLLSVFLPLSQQAQQVQATPPLAPSQNDVSNAHESVVLIAERPDPYQQASEELPDDLYAYYRIIERLTRANDLDVPYWDISIHSGEYIVGATASGAYNINIAENLLALQAGDVSAVAFVMAHEIAHHMHHHPAQLMAYQENASNSYSVHEYTDDSEAAATAESNFEDYANNFKDLSKTLELEADATALRYMAQAGFDVTSAPPALELYTKLYASNDELDERLEAMRSQITEPELATLTERGNLRLDISAPMPYTLASENMLRIQQQTIDYGTLIEEMFDQE